MSTDKSDREKDIESSIQSMLDEVQGSTGKTPVVISFENGEMSAKLPVVLIANSLMERSLDHMQTAFENLGLLYALQASLRKHGRETGMECFSTEQIKERYTDIIKEIAYDLYDIGMRDTELSPTNEVYYGMMANPLKCAAPSEEERVEFVETFVQTSRTYMAETFENVEKVWTGKIFGDNPIEFLINALKKRAEANKDKETDEQ